MTMSDREQTPGAFGAHGRSDVTLLVRPRPRSSAYVEYGDALGAPEVHLHSRVAEDLCRATLRAVPRATTGVLLLEILGRLRPGIGDERDRASWAGSRCSARHPALCIAGRRGRPAESLAVIEDAKSAHLARLVLAYAASAPDPETAELVRDALSRLAALRPVRAVGACAR